MIANGLFKGICWHFSTQPVPETSVVCTQLSSGLRKELYNWPNEIQFQHLPKTWPTENVYCDTTIMNPNTFKYVH